MVAKYTGTCSGYYFWSVMACSLHAPASLFATACPRETIISLAHPFSRLPIFFRRPPRSRRRTTPPLTSWPIRSLLYSHETCCSLRTSSPRSRDRSRSARLSPRSPAGSANCCKCSDWDCKWCPAGCNRCGSCHGSFTYLHACGHQPQCPPALRHRVRRVFGANCGRNYHLRSRHGAHVFVRRTTSAKQCVSSPCLAFHITDAGTIAPSSCYHSALQLPAFG